ncbi:MAG: hypothetical protein ABI925_04170 [Verrucomicrobiota bacterium]
MKPFDRHSFLSAIAVVALASCSQPERLAAPGKAASAGSPVSAVGKVTLHAGQPCASPIMFDFRITGARTTVQLGAPMSETRLLTDAANRNRRVRIWGNWRHGREPGCNYINITRVEPLSIAAMF